MLGTLVNTATIVIGSAVGALARRGLGKRYQEILYAAMGLAAVGIGVNAIVTSMSQSIYPVLFIASLAIGGVLGTAIDIDGRFSRFVSKRSKDGGGACSRPFHGNHDLLHRRAVHTRSHQQRPIW